MRLTTRAISLFSLLTVISLGISALGAEPVASEESSFPLTSTSLSTVLEPTDRPAERYQGSFFDTSVEAMLSHLNIQINSEDKVFAFPDPKLGLGSQISIYRAQTVLIKEGTEERLVRTWAKTVQELLEEQGLAVGSKDLLSLSRETVLTYQELPFSLTITRVAETEVEVKSSIPFEIITKDDPNLEQGISKTQTEGKTGVLKKLFLVRRENGKEVQRTLLSETVESQPVTKVVVKGTKPRVTVLTGGEKYKDWINEAALKYGVPADKLYKLMICESGGNPRAIGGGGLYKGLFQFSDSTWASNAFRSYDIFDPWAQINATASLWSRRSSMWPACSRTL